MQLKKNFFPAGFLSDRRVALSIWFGLCLLGAFKAFSAYGLNNYFIFKGVYYHAIHEQNLYLRYPAEYGDVNLYGPLFSIVIAPFASLPDKAGIILWVIFNAALLAFAIGKLPVPAKWQAMLLLLCGHELMISSSSLQVNPFICACLLLGFAYTHRGKEFLALFFIMTATFIKLYGITGLLFFFFSGRKTKFVLWAALWSAILFLLPLIITSFSFLLDSYRDWFNALKTKFDKNTLMGRQAIYQNVSVPGMIRRIFYLPRLNDLFVLAPAVILFFSQCLKYHYFDNLQYRLHLLCSALIATVIFSTSSESNTYIIAMPGICLWWLLQPRTKWSDIFFVAVFVLTTFAYTDILTPWARHHLYRPYSLKALAPFAVWLVILVQVHGQRVLRAVASVKRKDPIGNNNPFNSYYATE